MIPREILRNKSSFVLYHGSLKDCIVSINSQNMTSEKVQCCSADEILQVLSGGPRDIRKMIAASNTVPASSPVFTRESSGNITLNVTDHTTDPNFTEHKSAYTNLLFKDVHPIYNGTAQQIAASKSVAHIPYHDIDASHYKIKNTLDAQIVTIHTADSDGIKGISGTLQPYLGDNPQKRLLHLRFDYVQLHMPSIEHLMMSFEQTKANALCYACKINISAQDKGLLIDLMHSAIKDKNTVLAYRI